LETRKFLSLFCIVGVFFSIRAQDTTRSSGWIVIPVNEYGALRARAYPVEREAETPSIEASLTRVDYDLRVNGDLAVGQAVLTLDVFKDGWVRVPIPAGLLIREAKLDGKLVSLVPGGAAKGSPLCAFLSKRGRSTLSLDIALPVTSSAGEERLALPASASGITRASVTSPRQDVDVKVASGLLSEKSQTPLDSKWLAYSDGTGPLTFTWHRKVEDHRTSQPLRMRGSLTELVSLGEDSTTIYAEVNIEVAQGAARQVRLQLPSTVTINQVPGAMVADWEIKAGELVITFLEPVEQTARFTITGETHLPRDGGIDIPLLHLLETERDTGGVAVEVLGAGEIKDLKPQGLDKAEAAELGQTIAGRQSPSLAAFRFRSGPTALTRSLNVEIARYTQQAMLTANIEEARYRVLMSSEGKTLVQARYAVRNNQRSFVRIKLPAGAVVWSSSLAGRPARPGQAQDGSLLFPLMKTRAGEEAPPFAIEILYLVPGTGWSEKSRATLSLPALDLPVSRTGLQLYYPPTFKVTAEPGAFRTENFERPISSTLSAEGSSSVEDVTNMNASQLAAPSKAATQALVDRFRARNENRTIGGAVPVKVSFPAIGPSLFLVSELTAENQGPAIELSYQKDKKAGVK
jgi:hypothetical protein